ncbi:MAG: DNA polymerase [Candidatus Parvarchaeota archaeon]
MVQIKHILGTGKERDLKIDRNIVFIDTETRDLNENQVQQLVFGFCEYWKLDEKTGNYIQISSLLFQTNDDFWQYIIGILNKLNKKEILTLISFNANYDFSVLEINKYFKKYNITVKNFLLDYHKFNIQAEFKNKKIEIIDAINYFNGISLRELGKTIGIEKTEPLNNDYKNIEINETNIEYCKNDVKILRESIFTFIRFLKEHNLGSLKLTLASQSFYAFIKHYLKEDIEINHNNKDIIAMQRESYFGGKTDIHYKGLYKGPVTCFDINSLYPYIMKETYVPVKYLYSENNINVEKFLKEIQGPYGFVARLNITLLNKPLIPYRVDGRLLFVFGDHIDVTLNEIDVKNLLKNGMIINSVEKVAWFRKEKIFENFVTTLYNLRLKYKSEGNSGFSYICKVILNSLYGKFGQQQVKKYLIKNYPDVLFEDYDFKGRFCMSVDKELFQKMTGKKLDEKELDDLNKDSNGKYLFDVIKMFNNYYFVTKSKSEAFNSFPLIASYITSAARWHLQSLIDLIPDNKWLYCDTDSIFFPSEYEHIFIEKGLVGDELGQVKKEHFSELGMEIHNPKDYIIFNDLNSGKDIIKIKGVSKNSTKISDNVYKQLQFGSLKTALKEFLPGASVKEIQKVISQTYKKGYYDNSSVGYNIYPFKIVQKVETVNYIVSNVIEIQNSKDNSVLRKIVNGEKVIDKLKDLYGV